MNTTNNTMDCPRCEGKGEISAFKNVLGGVCFKCHGAGKVKASAYKKGFKFAVFMLNRETGKMDRGYNVTAQNSAQAIKKATVTFSSASSAYRDVYTMEGAVALRWDELADPLQMTLQTEED